MRLQTSADLVSCHALLLNMNHPELWWCVGGEDAGQEAEGEKNKWNPTSPRVRLSEEALRDRWSEIESSDLAKIKGSWH